jgi:large subunit ribosomal protein L1
MATHGKQYEAAVKQVEKDKSYSPQEAMGLAKKTAYAKFDQTVDLHLRLGLDPKNSAQQVRGVALLPHGLGKKVTVLVFAQGEAAKSAETAGADFVGADDLVQKIEGGWTEFDVAIATPDMMGRVGKLGRVLGRKGLMPNPKAGTVVPAGDLPRVIQDSRKGRVEFKLDRAAIIHVPIGKISFEEDKLVENLGAIVDAVVKAKPAGAKGQYVKTATIATTMGPGISLDLKSTLSLSAA